MFFREGKQTRKNRASSRYHIVPVRQLRKRAFREDRPVLAELIDALYNTRLAILAPAVVGQRKDMFRSQILFILDITPISLFFFLFTSLSQEVRS